jgi:hypothetical protein
MHFSILVMEMAQQLVTIKKEPVFGDEIVGVRKAICVNEHLHNISIVRYADGSIWVFCPYFGYIGSELGCKCRHTRCRHFKAV